MNYSALIQNRKSVREFSGRSVTQDQLMELRDYYLNSALHLIPELKTELRFFGTEVREALEGAAGYNSFLIGAPAYMVLLSEPHDRAGLNAGFLMEDLVLKLTDMGLGSCWITFTDSRHIKDALEIDSALDVAAIVAFGYGVKSVKRLRLNILSMSNVDIKAQRRYFDPKRSVADLVYLNTWGSSDGAEDFIGFFDDMLWEALYAASLAPSYLNRQAYGFLIRDGKITLVSRPDEYNTPIDGQLSLGIVLHHFTAAASQWAGRLTWSFSPDVPELPEGHKAIAVCTL